MRGMKINQAFVFFCRIDEPLNDLAMHWALNHLSLYEINKINRLKQKMDRDLTVSGKLLLAYALIHLGYRNIDLKKIKYNAFLRPLLTGADSGINVDFNISHSGNLTAVAIVNQGTVGLDIEEQQVCGTVEYLSAFCEEEKHWIGDDSSKLLRLWTRKEAVMKAFGKGFYQDISQLSVMHNVSILENKCYYIKEFILSENYFGTIVTSEENISLTVKEVPLYEVLSKAPTYTM
jgi:4'-phosphopantetheinyl transferase